MEVAFVTALKYVMVESDLDDVENVGLKFSILCRYHYVSVEGKVLLLIDYC